MNAIHVKCNILALVIYFSQSSFNIVGSTVCDNFDTKNLVNSQSQCQIHKIPIELNQYKDNISNRAIHLIPDVAIIQRCGGSCSRPSHRCVPKKTRMKSIPVMAISSHPAFLGIHEQQCGHVQVEEHLACHCNCPITTKECTSQSGVDKWFDKGTCRCLCTDAKARNKCIYRGMEWDETNCRCLCPVSSWRHCSTGYAFDYEQTCHCVPTSMKASLGLIAAMIVFTTCLFVIIIGGVLMFKKHSGVFKRRRSLHLDSLIVKESFITGMKEKEKEFLKQNSSVTT